MTYADEEHEEQANAPNSPDSEHNSCSSAETSRAAPDGSPSDEGAQRRPKRCKISREQLSILIKSFNEEPLPNFDQRQALAKVLGMTPRSVQIWFQNRRQRLKPAQTKSSSSNDMASSQLPFSRRPQSQGSAQLYGMPGLAAVANLCNRYSSELMGPAGMPQLPLSQGSNSLGNFVHSMHGLPYDVMEPFAATKALLGAGYHPPSSLVASRLAKHASSSYDLPRSSPQPFMKRPASASCESQSATDNSKSTAQSAVADSRSSPAPQADGLLLLLACAGDTAAQGREPFASSSPALVTYDRSATVVA